MRCLNCMKEYTDEYEKCPYCGFVQGTRPRESYHLYPGVMLAGKYIVGTVIGFGGFGVIYRAWDTNLETIVAIKEYYPTTFLNRVTGEVQVNVYDKKNLSAFEKGKREFLDEARNMAKFNSHPNIVHIYDFFEENGTAYFVMEYLDGYSLKTFMQGNWEQGNQISVETALQITQSVLSALKATHAAGIIHRDIKPGNIFICKDGTIKLIDFGAARFSDSETEKTRTIIITPGYAPAEQYQTKSKQGPYTDIYAMAAVLYEMLTGIKPEESINRKIEDLVEEPRVINPELPISINNAVMRAMAIQPEIRFQSVEQFSRALCSEKEGRDAKKEIRFRRRKRNSWIAAIMIMLLSGAFFCVHQFYAIRREAVLAPAMITIWTPYAETSQKEETERMFHYMVEEFQKNNAGVQVEITAIDANEYESVLKQALQEGTAPVLFDSSCLHKAEYDKLATLDSLLEFSLFDPGDYYFLEDYQNYYPSLKQFPLTFDVPVLYKNALLYQGEELEEIRQFTCDDFLGQRKAGYLGSIKEYAEVQQELPGIYTIEFPENTAQNKGTFQNLWSINAAASSDEYAAAIRLLYYFLSETAQDYLTVQNHNFLPLNRSVLQVYQEVNPDFTGLDKYIERVLFVGES